MVYHKLAAPFQKLLGGILRKIMEQEKGLPICQIHENRNDSHQNQGKGVGKHIFHDLPHLFFGKKQERVSAHGCHFDLKIEHIARQTRQKDNEHDPCLDQDRLIRTKLEAVKEVADRDRTLADQL